MRTSVELMRGWAAGAQAAAEPGCGGVSGAPGPVVSGEALIEGIGPPGCIARGVPWRRRIEGEELGPATARAAVDPVGAWGVGYGAVEVGPGAGVEFVHVVTLVAGRFPPPLRVRGEDAVIAVAVDTRRRNQARETVEELEGRETDPGASVPSGPG